jgi:hypothetical protein
MRPSPLTLHGVAGRQRPWPLAPSARFRSLQKGQKGPPGPKTAASPLPSVPGAYGGSRPRATSTRGRQAALLPRRSLLPRTPPQPPEAASARARGAARGRAGILRRARARAPRARESAHKAMAFSHGGADAPCRHPTRGDGDGTRTGTTLGRRGVREGRGMGLESEGRTVGGWLRQGAGLRAAAQTRSRREARARRGKPASAPPRRPSPTPTPRREPSRGEATGSAPCAMCNRGKSSAETMARFGVPVRNELAKGCKATGRGTRLKWGAARRDPALRRRHLSP